MKNASETLRAFIAIPLEERVLGKLLDAQERLRGRNDPKAVRWVPGEQMHLTLWFLGNVEAGRLGDLRAVFVQACAGVRPFMLRMKGIGCFPNMRRPNVIWAGVDGDVESLGVLQASIESAVRTFGSSDEQRKFHPHITFGRVKATHPAALRRIGEAIAAEEKQNDGEADFGSQLVTRVELFRSVTGRDGAEHTSLEAVTLG